MAVGKFQHRFRESHAACYSIRLTRVLLLSVLALVALQLFFVGAYNDSYGFDLSLRGPVKYDRNRLVADLLEMNTLNEICLTAKDAVISFQNNDTTHLLLTPEMDHTLLLEHLSDCHDVDVFLPSDLRSHGYCEDGMAYVQFLHARALPHWVFDMRYERADGTFTTYFELCPTTPLVLMNHYWRGVPDMAKFPDEKPVILMPNIEMHELRAQHYWSVDYVLCKTRDCYHRVVAWYAQEGNPRKTRVLYTQHTSSDPTTLTKWHSKQRAVERIKPRDFRSLRFFHANGHSTQKSTRQILDCWAGRNDLPPLDLYSLDDSSRDHYHRLFPNATPANVAFHWGTDVNAVAFGKLLAEAPVILCPSKMEGFGHYINQARASGALVLTTNGAPMNELVDANSGVLIAADVIPSAGHQMLAPDFKYKHGLRNATSMEYDVHGSYICDAVDKVLGMPPYERERRAANGRDRYLAQIKFFRRKMEELLNELRGTGTFLNEVPDDIDVLDDDDATT
ncbi:hypothetical protein SPRG_06175 [Saprolegnia parasitica CBS 223.65]|uniref:Glycosyl transferase family 1 domain-containing protein n=1 Tax=Saprolegnia parasitica (strain CBS 223.65) TaxID=695850 RepID=A0A067CEE6_SAPPC|nr:hypothetical protein SPRG_06175 [Saprolegnia parasitica CBS 223.65]KDO29119.1 hypothetical protein SPRG_06175 [Saprolegnia parasitica CBS 223.65]|eukprot:XP_012200285.1 hypothetical protein SPRG_06175 [Saprolegnia parasitica CBS 223.65]